jgi:hypothetical protein
VTRPDTPTVLAVARARNSGGGARAAPPSYSQEEVPNVSLEVGETLQGALYEEVSEPGYKRSLQLLSVSEVGELLGWAGVGSTNS